ncbi:MAG: H/ACA ribonucleoprotein complex subunit GAR1 [Halodesulfurarchaeum sp.]
MRRLGTVHRIAAGLLVVTAADADPPPIGTPVIDEHLDTAGRVVDVFGPTEAPYLAVTPDGDENLPQRINETLYWRPES